MIRISILEIGNQPFPEKKEYAVYFFYTLLTLGDWYLNYTRLKTTRIKYFDIWYCVRVLVMNLAPKVKN